MSEGDSVNTDQGRRDLWVRGLVNLILFALFALAEAVLFAATILQFLWMLLAGEKNRRIADFGERLGHWLLVTARFQTGQSDEKPFPWTDW